MVRGNGGNKGSFAVRPMKVCWGEYGDMRDNNRIETVRWELKRGWE